MPKKKTKRGSGRERLLQAAVQFFATEGFEGTSTYDICAAAKLTRPVLYAHFRGKKDLFRAAVEERIREFLAGVHAAAATQGTAEQRMAEVIWNGFQSTTRDPAHFRLIHRVLFGMEPVVEPKRVISCAMEELRVLMGIAADGIWAGELTGDAEEIAMSLIGLSQIHTLRYVLTGKGKLSKELARRCAAIVVRGCAKQVCGRGA